MKLKDQRLGMNQPIDRRDFLNGASLALGASMLPLSLSSCAPPTDPSNPYYPPSKMGMRGTHPGSFENAHAAVQGKQWQAIKTDEHYDLVVVGAGISGLSSAYMYLRDVDPKARILIVETHDDFGGHAKRNEFTVDGKTLIGFGGTMEMEQAQTYPEAAKQLVKELGIHSDNDDAYNHDAMLAELGLKTSTFFDKETFGEDYLAVGPLDADDSLDHTPLSDVAKAELKRFFADEIDYLAGMTMVERRDLLGTISWEYYLREYVKVGDEVITFLQKRSHGVWAIGADALPAWMAHVEGYPGFAGMKLVEDEDDEAKDYDEYNYFRFPDGNASIARLLVRKLVPDVAPGTTMEDVVTAKFDYRVLDRAKNQTRIRLNTTAVWLSHIDGNMNGNIEVTTVKGDEADIVTASKVIWAGYHALLPYVCDDIPAEQEVAMLSSVRAPLVYTSVAIRNWQSLVNLGVNRTYCPGMFYHNFRPTHPISIGDYEYAQKPDEPMVLHLQHIPTVPGLPAAEQFRAGRRLLLETPFETFERAVRDQLGRVLGPGGFDPARDIAGITVNRWPHGYAYSVDPETDEVAWWAEYWNHDRRPWVEARQRIGNIAIAGTDAATNAMSEAAIEEAYRAVHSFIK